MSEATTVTRAFELPLQGQLDGGKEVWQLLRECWQQATDLANWCVLELARRDVTRIPGLERLPPYPGVTGRKLKGLYGLASETFGFTRPGSWWAGACISASTICRDVEAHYRRERLAVLWQHRQALRTYRYPYPWPVHAQGWRGAWLEDGSGKPCIRVSLPGGAVSLRLRGGPEFGRQLGLFRQVVTGDLPKLALSIRQQAASTGCHRPALTEKAPGGGQGRPQRVLVKMVAKLPVQQKPGGRVLTLCTDPNAFWVAELDGRPAWVLNADHVKRMYAWLALHEDRLDRLSQDTKAERRLNVAGLRQLNESRARCCSKHARRAASWLHETAAHLTGFAVRQKVGTVLYRDREQGFIERFPWHRLKTLLVDKLRAAGIVCHCATDGEEVCVPATGEGD